MRMTLLQMVQSILSDTDSDEVSSINETVEADRVASILRDVYYEITSPRNIPELMRIIQLYGLSDSEKPTYLQIPTGVSDIQWFQYNIADFALDEDPIYQFRKLDYLEPYVFLDRISRRDSDATNVVIVEEVYSGSHLIIENDKQPQYYTTFDDKYIICDSWDATVEDTLQQYKTRVWAKYVPEWEAVDDYYPEIDSMMFPYLLAEAKSRCFSVLKGGVDPKIEQGARRQKTWIMNDRYNLRQDNKTIKYGR